MLPGDGCICMHVTFEFTDYMLVDTYLDAFHIDCRSKVRDTSITIMENMKLMEDHTFSPKSAHQTAMAATDSVVSGTDAACSRYLFPLLMVIWNVRSLFANGVEDTWKYTLKLMKSHNVGIFTETRSTDERIQVLRTHLPSSLLLFASGISSFWGGVALLVKRDFLKTANFATVLDHVIEVGRCIKLCLSGASGCLHIFAVYLDPSNSAARTTTMRLMKAAVTPNVHTMIAGDLNFTFTCDERLTFGGIASSPADSDTACVREWNQLFGECGFNELHQPGFTCRHPFGFSKIDK
jgi:exonuclease III